MKCIDCVFAMLDGLCLRNGAYTLLDADACGSFRPRVDVQVKMLKAENEQLRQRVTTQKQTIQAYRDESREWQEVAQTYRADNDRLRTIARTLYYCGQNNKDCDQCAMNGADMRVRLSKTERCDGINALVSEMGLVDE